MGKTEKLYDLNSALYSCKAEVLQCRETEKGYAVLLSATCFFPEGGGQPCDLGTIDGVPVTDVQVEAGEILHYCVSPLEPGREVACVLDFDRRFLHMQTHCGEHILSGVLFQKYGLRNVGFHMGKGYNTVDFNGEISPEMCLEVENEVNRILWKDIPVKVSYPSQKELEALPLRKRPALDEPLRVVEIEGVDCCCCCGTHVGSTAQVGLLRIVNEMRYKGGSRLTFLCGMDALRDAQGKHGIVRDLGAKFSCKPEQIFSFVGKLEEEVGMLKNALAGKGKYLAELLALRLEREAVVKDGVRYCIGEGEGLEPADCKTLALTLAGKENTVAFVYTGGSVPKYVLAKHPSADADLQALCQKLNEAFSGKGGGSSVLCQGSMSPALFGAIKEVLLG